MADQVYEIESDKDYSERKENFLKTTGRDS